MRGTTPNFLLHVRRPDSDVRQMVEAYAVAANGNGSPQDAIKKLKAEWDAADSLTGLSSLPSPNDGVQLAETSTTILDHSAVTAGQYATQLDKKQASFQCARIVLQDTNSRQVELLSVTARLNPAQGGAQQVAFWNCQLFSGVDDSAGVPGFALGFSRVTLVPICDPLVVAATNGTEGDVVFSFAGLNPKPRPKTQLPPPGFVLGPPPAAIMYVMIWGTKVDGSVASNVGWACESVASFSQNSDTAYLMALSQTTAPPSSGGLGSQPPLPGSSWWTYVLSTTQTPRIKLVYNTGTTATIAFSGANKPDLGGVPTATVEFTGQGEIPAGSSIVYQVQADDATWLTFTDGQTTDQLTAANPSHAITKRQTYAMRATLNPSAASDATPTLRALGVRALTITDLSDVAEVEGGEVTIDPTTLKCTIAQATLRALRDGIPDYRDATTTLLIGSPFGSLEFRVYRGGRNLPRGDWLLQRTFRGDDINCPGADLELTLISPLSRVRGQLPVYNPGTGLRIPLKYSGSTLAAAFADIRDGQLGLPARLRGPGPSDTSVVGKTIPPNAQAVASAYTTLRSSLVRNLLDQQSWQTVQAHDELEALSFLAGGAFIESQGRLKYVPLCEGSIGSFNIVSFPRDCTNGIWTKSNCTAALDQPGAVDGLPNAASSLLATAANAFCFQTIVDTSKTRRQSAWIKRLVGTGPIQMTMDSGANWITIPVTSSYQRFEIPSQTLANPGVGYRIVTSGDKIAVDLMDNNTGSGFNLTPEAIVMSFHADEILWGRVSPGFAMAVPEYYVPWNWNQAAQRLDYEYRAFNGPALLNLSGIGSIDAVQTLPTEIGQWITSDGVDGNKNPTSTLAQKVAVRQATLLGGGVLVWDFLTTYEYPELEEGDLVAVPTSYFVAQNPITNAPVSGWLMAIGKVVGTDLTGRRFKVWIRRWNDLIPDNSLVPRRQFANPVIRSGSVYLAYDGSTRLNLICQDAGSVRVAASKVSMPTDATVRAATPQVLTSFSTLTDFVLGVTLNPLDILYLKAFAYEAADGSGNESAAITAQLTANFFGNSTPLNQQGSTLPIPWAANLFSFTWGGLASGQMFVAFSWSAQTITRPDSSTISVPAPPTALAAPTLSQVAGGTRSALTLFARIALVRDGQYMGVSAESSLAVNANSLLKITSPSAVAGYDGWVPLIGSATNAEWLQDTVAGSIKAFGTDYTEPTTHFATGVTQYNSAMLGAVFYADLLASTTYYFYATYDIAQGFIRFLPFVAQGSGSGDTAPSMADAAKAWTDGRIALTPGSFTVTVGAGGGSAGGNTGGSRLT